MALFEDFGGMDSLTLPRDLPPSSLKCSGLPVSPDLRLLSWS